MKHNKIAPKNPSLRGDGKMEILIWLFFSPSTLKPQPLLIRNPKTFLLLAKLIKNVHTSLLLWWCRQKDKTKTTSEWGGRVHVTCAVKGDRKSLRRCCDKHGDKTKSCIYLTLQITFWCVAMLGSWDEFALLSGMWAASTDEGKMAWQVQRKT